MSKIKTSIEQMPLKKIKFSANSDSVLIGVEIDHVLDNREEMQTNRDNNLFESLVISFIYPAKIGISFCTCFFLFMSWLNY